MATIKGHRAPSNGRVVGARRGLKRKRGREDDNVDNLITDVASLDVSQTPQGFAELPLSSKTKSGLEASHFKTLTNIQSRAIPRALKGDDILGAAKTGSGKTLAFLVPVLENLYRKGWTDEDGLGCIVLSPTRELAMQIFEVLRKVGRLHTFSAGLVIGGKNMKDERERMGRMNILIATPGRMLQHMDQTSALNMHNLQILVLDEADRIMDMGFKDTVDAIIEHLPPSRQTLMFSATQTKRVSDLARLSLRAPEFVAVHEAAESATPSTLQQNYVLTPLPEKFDTLWSFIRANVKKKILVFLSSGKQVRFVYESLRHLQPGVPLLHLHGRQKQTARLEITSKFARSQFTCLFATDVVARGLDFPAVDWVVQVDAPEDADTYIHRVGRTARYEHEGKAILFLDPSEEPGMLRALEQKKIVLEKINIRQGKMQSTIRHQLQNMCFQDPQLKYLGQKAFSSYVRSIHLQKEKQIFNVHGLDLQGYAASLGLPGAPRVKFVQGDDAKVRKNASRQHLYTASDGEDADESTTNQPAVRTKYDRMFERQNQDVLAKHYAKMINDGENSSQSKGQHSLMDSEGETDFLSVKRRFQAGDEALGQNASSADDGMDESGSEGKKLRTPSDPTDGTRKKAVKLSDKSGDMLIIDSKRREKLLKSKKKLAKLKRPGEHVHFDEDGVPHSKAYYEEEADFTRKGRPEDQRSAFLLEEKERTSAADAHDKEVAREKRREKREKRKQREREEAAVSDGEAHEDTVAMLELYEENETQSEPSEGRSLMQKRSVEQDYRSKAESRGRGNVGDEAEVAAEDLETEAMGLLAESRFA